MADDDLLEGKLEGKEVQYIPLEVSSGILLHIGAGIYNSIAGAIKELVSNAYDADATRVIITTNYPSFDQITVIDNGSGMTAGRFTKAMRSIGSSLKRDSTNQGVTPVHKRPIIGNLGIGLMALSQVCKEATIESQVPDAKKRFVAKLDFTVIRERTKEQVRASKLEILQERAKDYERKREKDLTNDERDDFTKAQDEIEALVALEVAQEAKKIAELEGQKEPLHEHLGYCLIYELPAMSGRDGTKITLHPLDPAVIATLQDHNRGVDALPKRLLPEEYQTSSIHQESKRDKSRNIKEEENLWQGRRDRINDYDWRKLCEYLRLDQLSYQELPQYHQFLWQLAMMSPVRYFPEGPVIVKQVLRDKRKQLEKFKFSLIVDNRELFKPVLLPSAKIGKKKPNELREGLDYFVDAFQDTREVNHQQSKSELRFNGYIYWQVSQNQPSTVRGIEIYIRNVGIGLYDHTLLNFATVNPTSRAGQLSGEIYIENGLEDALNVDRNSFRETDAEYIALQEYVWKKLGSTSRGDGLLGKSVDSYWERKGLKEKDEERKHLTELRGIVESIAHGKLDVELSRAKGDKWFVEDGKRNLTIYLNSEAWPRSAVERRRIQKILVPLKVALMVGYTSNELLKKLEEILL